MSADAASAPAKASGLANAKTGMVWVASILMVLLALNGARGLNGNALQLISSKNVPQVQPSYWKAPPQPEAKPGKE